MACQALIVKYIGISIPPREYHSIFYGHFLDKPYGMMEYLTGMAYATLNTDFLIFQCDRGLMIKARAIPVFGISIHLAPRPFQHSSENIQ